MNDLPKHTFAITAYKESPYLESCIRSLVKQREQGADVILCTSTPNAYIRDMAEKYEIDLYVREGESSLKADWNYAAETAKKERGARLVTIAHQDDIYAGSYHQELMKAVSRYPDMLVFFTGSETIDGEGNPAKGTSESVKVLLRTLLRLKPLSGMGLIKRSALCFGNAVCCPSCSYDLEHTGLPLFQNDYRFVIDWDTMLRLSYLPGRFICNERKLMRYRVHSGSETKKNIVDHTREREETEIYMKIWPRPIVGLLMHFYKKAYNAYEE